MSHKAPILAAAIAALGLASPAIAAPAGQTSTLQQVYHADLDMSSAQGQAELQRRVDRAAWQVCNVYHGDAKRAPRTDRQCYREARQQGQLLVAELMANQPLLGG